jgi:hypothetical protein
MTDRSEENFNLDELFHPASAFGHPSEVVNDPDLTLMRNGPFWHHGLPMPVP